MKKKRRKKRFEQRYLLVSFALIVIATGAIMTKSYLNTKREKQDIENGYLTLKGLENKDMEAIEKEVFAVNEKAEAEKNKKDPNLSNEEYFENSVFMGDSITEGMSFYKAIDSSRVVAVKGQNVVGAKKNVDKVMEKNPNEVFLLYGMNDLETFDKSSDFIREYTSLISCLKEKLPNTKIYIESILPTSSKVKNKSLTRQRIDEFNKAIEEMCKTLEINCINTTTTIDGREDLYEPDGLHPKAVYYDGLLKYIKNNI